ncbi:hypothetical protein HK102_001233 [Quaeritorhiza haematococci]|nr:hypothetical protein HK102_001233 [Quaeritorhiza haematococci]
MLGTEDGDENGKGLTGLVENVILVAAGLVGCSTRKDVDGVADVAKATRCIVTDLASLVPRPVLLHKAALNALSIIETEHDGSSGAKSSSKQYIASPELPDLLEVMAQLFAQYSATRLGSSVDPESKGEREEMRVLRMLLDKLVDETVLPEGLFSVRSEALLLTIIKSVSPTSLPSENLDKLNPRTLSTLVIAPHLPSILETEILPYFRKRHSKLGRTQMEVVQKAKRGIALEGVGADEAGRSGSGGGERENHDFEFYEDQPWKYESADCVPLHLWVLEKCQFPAFNNIQHLFVPPLLTLLDDYDVHYKMIGVRLLEHVVIRNCTENDVRVTGIGGVFCESLTVATTFHSAPSLVHTSLSALISLSVMMEVSESAAYYKRLEALMASVVVRGLRMSRGGKSELVEAFLDGAITLTEKMGLVTVKFLKTLVAFACEILDFGGTEIKTQIKAAKLVRMLMRCCWPRYTETRINSQTSLFHTFPSSTADKELKMFGMRSPALTPHTLFVLLYLPVFSPYPIPTPLRPALDHLNERIPPHRGLILRSIAECWRYIGKLTSSSMVTSENEKGQQDVEEEDLWGAKVERKDINALKEELTRIVRAVYEICGESMQADIQFLLYLDKDLYGELVGGVPLSGKGKSGD